jgi:hypothetical protein
MLEKKAAPSKRSSPIVSKSLMRFNDKVMARRRPVATPRAVLRGRVYRENVKEK